MKDSGIEWIGEIPVEWNICRMKSCISKRDSGSWGEEANGTDGDVICLRIADFDYTKFKFKDVPTNELTTRHYSYDTIHSLLLQKDDILIEKSGGGEKTPVGRTVIFDKDYPALYANFMDRLRCSNMVLPLFMEYIFVSFYKNRYTMNYIKQTTGIQNLDLTSMLSKEMVALPPLDEQHRIADFLDRKCAEIDRVLEKTRASIEEYKKLKQSVITQAVTKGIRGEREMKDSGVEWIGEIPSTWNIVKGKYRFRERNSRGNNINLQLLSPTQKYGVIPQNLYEELTGMKAVKLDEKADLSTFKTIYSGDFCISLRSFQGGFEYSEYNGVVSPAYHVFYGTTPLCNHYFKYLFKTKSFIEKMASLTKTFRDGKSISFTDFSNSLIPIPPLEEQHRIADFLDRKCAEIDTLISKKEQFITEIEAYKKSLIYEYVTGKKEVQ